MSEINAEVGINPTTGEIKGGGGYKSVFNGPSVIKSCEHYIHKERKGIIRNRRDLWFIIIHGTPFGVPKVTRFCTKQE